MPIRWRKLTLAGLLGICLPSTGWSQTDRPTELPNLLPTPNQSLSPRVEPKIETPNRNPNRAEYDPSFNYLPDRNPGSKLPPCPCLPLGRMWVEAGYFLGTTRSDIVPALVLGGGTGNPRSPGTVVLEGESGLTHRFRSGLRLDFGAWLDRCQNLGVQGQFFNLETNQVSNLFTSDGSSVSSRPFAVPGTGTGVELIAGPNLGSGAVQVQSPLSLLTADVNARLNATCEDQYRLDWLVGYRFFRLDENLRIDSQSSLRQIRDDFQTGNVFHGAQIGLTGEYRWERVYVDATGKIAFGRTEQELEIQGGSRLRNGSLGEGLLAAATNRGRTSRNRYGVVPETDLKLGYQVGDHLRVSVGYTFLYISNVARPRRAIDTTISPAQLGLQPTRLDPASDIWVQGLTLGLEMRY